MSQPSRSRMVSAAPASMACWRSSTLASSATDLMSQRAQRVSSAVMQLTPRSSTSRRGQRAAARRRRIPSGSTCGSGAWLRPYSAPRDTCRYTYRSPPPLASISCRHQRAPLALGVRIGDAELAQAAAEARQMRGQAPRLAVPCGDDLVDAVAEQKAAIERRDARLAQRQQAAVEMADRQRLGHDAPTSGTRARTVSLRRLQKPPCGHIHESGTAAPDLHRLAADDDLQLRRPASWC